MLKILFADDHNLVREGIRPFLEQLAEGADVREAEDLDAALTCFKLSDPPDLVMLDLYMPGMNGLEGIARVKSSFPNARVAVISGYYDKRLIQAVMGAGANGFILKISSGRGMLDALRAILDGETYVPNNSVESTVPSSLPMGLEAIAQVDGPWSKLTQRESDVLRLIIDGQTNKEIGRTLELHEITVKGHLRNAYKKIGAGNRADAVRIALQRKP